MPSLPTETVTKLRATIDAATADPHKGIPGTAIVIVDRHGTELFAHASGLRGLQASTQPMTLTDSVFWIASCTKLVTGIACLQLVERGLLKLDDAAQLEKELCPELAALQVLRPDGTLEAKRVGITLRMLLTHTAGFGYSFFNPRLRDWGFPAGVDEFSGRVEDMLMPLLFQPGEGWEYGVSKVLTCLRCGERRQAGVPELNKRVCRSTSTGQALRSNVRPARNWATT